MHLDSVLEFDKLRNNEMSTVKEFIETESTSL